MILLKMRIKRSSTGGSTHYDYPVPFYDAYKVIFGPYYESGLEEVAKEVRDRADDDEFIIIGVDEDDAPNFLKANGHKDGEGFEFSCVELSQAEMEELGSKWTKQQEKITDNEKVTRILAKSARGVALTQEEKDALDPEKSEVGINLTKHFKTELSEAISAHNAKKGKK